MNNMAHVKWSVSFLIKRNEKVNGYDYFDYHYIVLCPVDALHFAQEAKKLGYKPNLRDLLTGVNITYMLENK